MCCWSLHQSQHGLGPEPANGRLRHKAECWLPEVDESLHSLSALLRRPLAWLPAWLPTTTTTTMCPLSRGCMHGWSVGWIKIFRTPGKNIKYNSWFVKDLVQINTILHSYQVTELNPPFRAPACLTLLVIGLAGQH